MSHANAFSLQWDVSGATRAQALAPLYCPTLDRVWIVYDVSDKHSFDSMWLLNCQNIKLGADNAIDVRTWYRSFCIGLPTHQQPALVGNKIDLVDRVVTTQQGQALAQELGALFFEISAKTNQGVQEMASDGFHYSVKVYRHSP